MIPFSELHVGQVIEWKRQGERGTYYAVIRDKRPGAARPLLIEILHHSWAGETNLTGTERHITLQHVLRILPPDSFP